MKIETKYDIGQKVWTAEIYIREGIATIDVLSGIISGINIEKNGRINYFFDEWCVDYYEEDIIAYEDTEELINRIKRLDNEIKEKK